MARLSYDATGLMTGAIGEERGLDAAEIAGLEASLEAARAALVEAHTSGHLGFMRCADDDGKGLMAWADAQDDRWTDQVVLGIGGSSLGARAVLEAARGTMFLDGLRTHFSENVDPISFMSLLEGLDLATTRLILISKSGNTIETMSKFWILYDRIIEQVGEEEAARHVIAITDPEKGALRDMVERYGWESFPVPSNVGGRFSVLTAVGLLPLALAGYPIDALLDGARNARDRALADPVAHNACLQAAAHQILLARRGVNQCVMMAYSDQLLCLVDWFRQLWAESLGKAKNRAGETVHTGITPISALGVIDQHSQVQLYMEGPADKHIAFVELAQFGRDVAVPEREGFAAGLEHLQGKTLGQLLAAELEGTRKALQAEQRPTSRWVLAELEPEAIGAFLMSWQIITAIAGELLDINAFDQPGVELGKKIAHGLLGDIKYDQLATSMSDEITARNEAHRLIVA
jgi:glucose-6-phosphate isomerase